jgi:hypothetical protein
MLSLPRTRPEANSQGQTQNQNQKRNEETKDGALALVDGPDRASISNPLTEIPSIRKPHNVAAQGTGLS